MFSSFSFSLPFRSRLSAGSNLAIDLKSVAIYDVEAKPEKRARALKHLLKLNHAKYAVLFNKRRFHNHTPHILGSAYLFGATSEHLQRVYDEETRILDQWEDSPGEISRHDWRDYLGDSRYERAYLDFYEDELVDKAYDWRKVVEEYLFTGEEPLFSGLIGGLGHPLIHLGYAFELSSRDVAMEALDLGSVCYSFMHKYLDDAKYTKVSTYSTSSPLDILKRVHEDERFDKLFDREHPVEIEQLFENLEDAVLEHWNAWHLADPKKQFEDSQYAAAALLVATHEPNTHYDFFLLHILTTSHAVRILLPLIPPKFHVPLVRQWWLLTLAVYITQLRPAINLERITDVELQGRDWDWVDNQALTGKHSTETHHVKGLRALKEAAHTWGDDGDLYLKAAVKFAVEFNHWGGFDS